MSVRKCQGTLLAPPHPTPPHPISNVYIASCRCASAKERLLTSPHPTPSLMYHDVGAQVPRNVISPPHPISNVASCQCARPGTLLAPPHPSSPHVPSCWRASTKEAHPTPAHRTSMPCTTSKYTIAKTDNPFRAASQPIPLSMNMWSMILEL